MYVFTLFGSVEHFFLIESFTFYIISSFFMAFFKKIQNKKESFLKINLSSTGTTERVCLIQGTVEALNAVHGFIAEKIREMPQNVAKTEPVSILQPQTTVNPDRIKQVSV